MSKSPSSKKHSFMDHFEESCIAVMLGLMTLITFANVIARYVFQSNLLWALEATVYIFAWMVLLGASYGVKKTTHIGVDVLTNLMSPWAKKISALLATSACLIFALLLLKGSWDFWYPFTTKQIWYEVNDIPMPAYLSFLGDLINDGEAYEKIPRFIPYFIMPLSMALLSWRFLVAGYEVFKGTRDSVIASHEAEELMEEAGLTGEPK